MAIYFLHVQITGELVDLAHLIAVDVEPLWERLRIEPSASGNGGNATTQAVKFATKYHRARGVHVTPTVFVNGCVSSRQHTVHGLVDFYHCNLLTSCLSHPVQMNARTQAGGGGGVELVDARAVAGLPRQAPCAGMRGGGGGRSRARAVV